MLVAPQRLHGRIIDDFHGTSECLLKVKSHPAAAQNYPYCAMRLNVPGFNFHAVGPACMRFTELVYERAFEHVTIQIARCYTKLQSKSVSELRRTKFGRSWRCTEFRRYFRSE